MTAVGVATPMWRTDEEQDALWVIWRPVMDWQDTLPSDHPLKWVGPCTHCVHCKGALIRGYDGPGSGWFHGPGSGWFHMYDAPHALGIPECRPDLGSDPETCECTQWQAAVAAALDAQEATP